MIMANTTHQWTTFEKGRLRVQACAHCGEMNLSSNAHSFCDKENVLVSPVVRAGYKIMSIDQSRSEKVA